MTTADQARALATIARLEGLAVQLRNTDPDTLTAEKVRHLRQAVVKLRRALNVAGGDR